MRETHTLIIGAGFSGLASAACLQEQHIDYTLIEKQDRIADAWHRHYDRLHLHTSKKFSHLPYKKFGRHIPKYPDKQQVIEYLNDYQQAFHIDPVFNTEAKSVKRTGDYWTTETNHEIFRSKYVVMAGGVFSRPHAVNIPGMDSFPGKILHSSAYKTGKDFSGQQVLVIGFGNSACEIAIDLYEQGAIPSLSVRSPVNVVPRDILGIPILELSILLSRLSPRVADAISAPLIRALIGDLDKLGLKKMPYGPLEEIRRDGNVPVLDIGTIQHIREKHIRIYGDIENIVGSTVHFKDGKKTEADAIVAAIGYERGVDGVIDVEPGRFEDLRVCAGKQKYFGKDGLYFCGYWVSPTGQIREIALDAQKIARDIVRKESNSDSQNSY